MLSGWLYEWWTRVYVVLLRPMWKWLLRYVTGKCELLRITYEETDQATRVRCIESSLNSSHDPGLRKFATDDAFDVSEAVKYILSVKAILPEVHAQFELRLRDSLMRIRAYNHMWRQVESIRVIKYDAENEDHEALLLELWDLYKGDTPLPSRVGPHWQDMGFQGDDPKTDFRGMGLLGLQQMMYSAAKHPHSVRQVFSQSHHPQYGFSFAIVAINITGMAYDLLRKRKLQSHFYSLEKSDPGVKDFHEVYNFLLYEFTQFWFSEKPKDIMEFSRVRDKFYKQMKHKLRSDRPLLMATDKDE